jgi:hypothetical protein
MNQIKFQDPNNNRDFFLPSSTAFQFFNDIVKTTQNLTLLGGQNYILQGCTVNNNTVAPGFIVYNGELFYFTGGIFPSGTILANAKLHITETPSGQEVYNNQVQTGARITRTLTLVSDGNTNQLFYNLSRITPIQTLTSQLNQALYQLSDINTKFPLTSRRVQNVTAKMQFLNAQNSVIQEQVGAVSLIQNGDIAKGYIGFDAFSFVAANSIRILVNINNDPSGYNFPSNPSFINISIAGALIFTTPTSINNNNLIFTKNDSVNAGSMPKQLFEFTIIS